MVVCSYFLRGQCRYGESCKNEHPRDALTGQNQTFGNKTWTAPTENKPVASFTVESISKDLTANLEKPLWPLSSYSPAKYEPNLVSTLDESPEELRVKATIALQTGATNDYIKYESDKISQANQIYAGVRNHASQAYEQAVRQSVTTIAAPSSSAFGGNTTVTGSVFDGGTTSAFGKPSTFGALGNTPTTTAFAGASTSVFQSTTGKSVFGSTTAPASVFAKSTFGQPSFGQTSNPTVPSSFAAAKPASVFGQPQQPSTFGQVSQPQSTLIKPPSGAFGSGSGGSTFGQPSFGAAVPTQPTAFGGTSGTSGTASGTSGGFSAFAGQPSTFGLNAASNSAMENKSVFGQSAFGTVSNPAPVFGTPASAFGNPPSTQATTSAFGEPSAFGALTQQQSGPVSAFGGSAFSLNSSANTTGSAFNSTSAFTTQPTSFSSQQPQNQPVSAFASIAEAPRPTSVFGQLSQNTTSAFSSSTTAPSSFKKSDPPDLSAKKAMLEKYDSLLPDNYLQILPKAAIEAFESKKFVWGKIPEWIPPKELR